MLFQSYQTLKIMNILEVRSASFVMLNKFYTKLIYNKSITEIPGLDTSGWGKSQPPLFTREKLDMFDPIYCFQQVFWLNIRPSTERYKQFLYLLQDFSQLKVEKQSKNSRISQNQKLAKELFLIFFQISFGQMIKNNPPDSQNSKY